MANVPNKAAALIVPRAPAGGGSAASGPGIVNKANPVGRQYNSRGYHVPLTARTAGKTTVKK